MAGSGYVVLMATLPMTVNAGKTSMETARLDTVTSLKLIVVSVLFPCLLHAVITGKLLRTQDKERNLRLTGVALSFTAVAMT